MSTLDFEHDGPENSPVHRLVEAIVGSKDDNEHAIALANRVLASQIGTNSSDSCIDGTLVDLSSTWRRISRKARRANAKTEIEELYALYGQEFYENEKSDLPAKVILTLTKLMGKRIVTFAASSKSSSMFESQTQSRIEQKISVDDEAKKNETFSMAKRNEKYRSAQRSMESENSTNVQDGIFPHHQQQNHMLAPPTPVSQPNTFVPNSQARKNPIQRRLLEKEELQLEEKILLKECLYSLQGIDGERIKHYHKDAKDDSLPNLENYEGIRIQTPVLSQNISYTGQISETRLGSGALDALRICGEAGWLYARIKSYIFQVQQDRTKGVVARAFAEALAEQLRDYHALLTTYESKLPGFTLRQMLVELQGPTFRLKTLAMLVDGMQGLTGGYLLSALYKHSIHGNTTHVKIVQSILLKASRPWFEILYGWTAKGILSDPWNEFFVVEDRDVADRYLWDKKYFINQDLVPKGILNQEYVKPSLNVGKGINFIRRCLMDGQWTMQLDALTSNNSDEGEDMESRLGYRYEVNKRGNQVNYTLSDTLNSSMALVHNHILSTLREENHLMHHLFALKQFMLLGQGDFFSALMDGLHSEFNHDIEHQSGSRGIYKHSLLMIVESALRSTNAKYLPQYILDRLQVELILYTGKDTHDFVQVTGKEREQNQLDQRKIYDVFMFDYQVPDPILSIVHTNAMKRYQILFSLLFRLKNIEFMLNFTWRQSATLQHALQTTAQYTGIEISSSIGYARATFVLRNISIVRQSMIHLIVNLKSYLMFEVIEGCWEKLESAIDDASTLDEVIEVHDSYLECIIRRAMVRVPERNDSSLQNVLANQVDIVLSIAKEFCSLQERIFNQASKEAEISAQKRVESEGRLKRGQWGFETQLDVTEQETFFGLSNCSIMKEVARISREYNSHALALLRALNNMVNGTKSEFCENSVFGWENDDMPQRFLIAQLDHNNFYANQRE